MKKMIMMAVVLAMAVGANAGTLIWGASGLTTANPDGTFTATALNGAIGYLFYGAQDTVALNTAIQGKTFTGAGYLATRNTSASGSLNASGIGPYVSQDVTLYMVMFDAATIGGANFYMISTDWTQTFGASGNKTYGFTSAPTHMPGQWTAVPEPTSFALVGLGAAALALRRRIRKA